MHDVIRVTVVQRSEHLLHYVCRLMLREVFSVFELLDDLVKELASFQVIHYNQEGVSVLVELVDFDDGWVVLGEMLNWKK